MKNVAGCMAIEERDRILELELTRVGVPVARVDVTAPSTVASHVRGSLGPFTFERGPAHWGVTGPFPLHVAEELYATPVGRTDIRADGRARGYPPAEFVHYFDAEGNELSSDPTGEEGPAWDLMAEQLNLTTKRPRFVPDAADAAAHAVVQSFHVDSELGLYLLVEAIGRHGLALPSFTPGTKGGPVENCEAFFAKEEAHIQAALAKSTAHTATGGRLYDQEEAEVFVRERRQAQPDVSRSAPSNVTYNPPPTELFTVVVDPAMPEGMWAMRPLRPGDVRCPVCGGAADGSAPR